MDTPYKCRVEDGIKQHSLFQTLNNVNDSERNHVARDRWRTDSDHALAKRRNHWHQVCSSLARVWLHSLGEQTAVG